MKRTHFENTEIFEKQESRFLENEFASGRGSPTVDIFVERTTGAFFQVFQAEYGEKY